MSSQHVFSSSLITFRYWVLDTVVRVLFPSLFIRQSLSYHQRTVWLSFFRRIASRTSVVELAAVRARSWLDGRRATGTI
jgi:hypothetical protein